MTNHATQQRSPVFEDVTLEEIERDPYPIYARLRRESPVAWLPLMGAWLITRYEDCDRLGSDDTLLGPSPLFEEFFGPNIGSYDGELHRWLRAGVDPPLRPKAVQGYIEELARPVSREYVGLLRPRGGCDATVDLLERISVRVVGNVLGYGEIDDDTLQRWFTDLSGGSANLAEDSAIAATGEQAKLELDAYTKDRVEQLTKAPDESGLSHMIHSGLDGRPPRTFEELRGTIRLIILGGLQEPGHGAAASLLGVLMDDEQRDLVLANPKDAVGRAVHEGLRWISPFNMTERQALRDIEVGGATILAGDNVMLGIGSANRDESRYEDGERFDLTRPRQTHQAFGYGAHICAGHFLSRRLEQIMLEEIFAGLPGLRLDPDHPPTVSGFMIRSVRNLPVLWEA